MGSEDTVAHGVPHGEDLQGLMAAKQLGSLTSYDVRTEKHFYSKPFQLDVLADGISEVVEVAKRRDIAEKLYNEPLCRADGLDDSSCNSPCCIQSMNPDVN